MKTNIFALICALALPLSGSAAIHYVNANNATPAPPYLTWATAATAIQDAVDVSSSGDEVVVTNGTYASGGRAVSGLMTNRVALDRAIFVHSVNGPQVTTIRGYQLPGTTNGDGAIRCVYLTNGVTLAGFTLTSGATRTGGDWTQEQLGGGIFCPTYPGGTVSNCVIIGNAAASSGGGVVYCTLLDCTVAANWAILEGGGAHFCNMSNCVVNGNYCQSWAGGVFGGILNNCMVISNSCTYGSGGATYFATLNNCTLSGNTSGVRGGAAWQATLNNCTITGNSSSSSAGGVEDATVNNCIVYFNTGPYGNYLHSTLNYSCTTPLPPIGSGNTATDPLLASSSHLSAASPCRAAGNAANTSGIDIDGEPWGTPPSIGCDEYRPGFVTGPLTVAIRTSSTSALAGDSIDLIAMINGRTTKSTWDFADGLIVTNQPYTTHSWSAGGDYTVTLRAFNESQPDGVSATVTIHIAARPIHYVAINNPTPAPPYTSWATAATNIQQAIDAAAVAGALVLVSNGTYATGARVVAGSMSNRVAVTKPVILRSVNGPQLTLIQGYQVPGTTNGDSAVRCVYLTNGARLFGFTLTYGATRTNGDLVHETSGGGVWCEFSDALVSNCVITGNAAMAGGGAYWGQLINCVVATNRASFGGGAVSISASNCTFSGNAATEGGGADAATLNRCILAGNVATNGGGCVYSSLNNCAVFGNSAVTGGGLYEAHAINSCAIANNSAMTGGGVYGYTNLGAVNSIIFFNTAPNGSNYFSPNIAFFNNCCTAPLPAANFNITNDPVFVDFGGGNLRLQSNSPCIDSGYNDGAPPGPDLDGNPRIVGATIDIGAYEYPTFVAPYIVSEPADQTVTAGLDAIFTVSARGTTPLGYQWKFKGADLAGATDSSFVLGKVQPTNAGPYSVVVSNIGGTALSRSAILTVRPPVTHYVNGNATTPVSPFTNWAAAAVSIQDAVDACVAGDEVVVTNGIYATGGRAITGLMTNRVAMDKPLRIGSVKGPAFTFIQGYQVPGTTNGDGAIRCVFLTNGASLSGFTLMKGATRNSGDIVYEQSGGGVLASTGTISHCVIIGNSASAYGGGAYPAYGGSLNDCVLSGNSASYGGGALGYLNNCTVAGNSASTSGGGVWAGTLNNCIVYSNNAPDSPNYNYCYVNYCCTTPLPDASSGGNNITSSPLFQDPANGNFRLQSASPCINAGNSIYVLDSTDLDSYPRIVGGAVDIGAYEFQGPSGTNGFHAWLAQYGLPTDGSADYTDSDGDGMNNYQEWRAGTNPTNAASALRIISALPNGTSVLVTWQSVLGVGYFVQRSTNLTSPSPFTTIATNIPGQLGTTSFMDTNSPGTGPRFYRIGAE